MQSSLFQSLLASIPADLITTEPLFIQNITKMHFLIYIKEKPDNLSEIPDIYEYFIEHEGKGIFRVKPYCEIQEKDMSFILSELEKDAITYKLKNNPQHPMSIFLSSFSKCF